MINYIDVCDKREQMEIPVTIGEQLNLEMPIVARDVMTELFEE